MQNWRVVYMFPVQERMFPLSLARYKMIKKQNEHTYIDLRWFDFLVSWKEY